jgi:hypothetical protein
MSPIASTTPFRRRRIVCAIAWIGCVPGLFGYALLSLMMFDSPGRSDAWGIAFVYVSVVFGWFAWGVLVVMSRAWIADRPCTPVLPIAGTAAVGIAIAPLASHWMPLVLVSPGVLLACWLVFWHLRAAVRQFATPGHAAHARAGLHLQKLGPEYEVNPPFEGWETALYAPPSRVDSKPWPVGTGNETAP